MKHTMVMICLVAISLSAQASTESEHIKVSGELNLGARHDSNVDVAELDSSANRADNASTASGELKVAIKPNNKWSFSAGLQHSISRYNVLDEFDLDITTLSTTGSYKSSIGKLGMHYYDAKASLANADFLNYKQHGISIGNLALANMYWRLSLDSIDKRFTNLSQRNANTNSLRADGFWFYQTDGFVNLSVIYHDENTIADEFDYKGNGIQLAVQHPIELFGVESTFNAALEFQNRDYLTSEIEQGARDDNRAKITASLNYPLLDFMDLNIRAESGNYNSNFSDVDYRETVTELGLRLYF